jgi:hypothetical protein
MAIEEWLDWKSIFSRLSPSVEAKPERQLGVDAVDGQALHVFKSL